MTTGASAGSPGSGGAWADNDTRATLHAIERWKQTAADQVDDISGWRSADPSDRHHKYWTGRESLPETEHGSSMPRGFERDTTYLVGWMMSNPTGHSHDVLKKVYAAISAWHADHTAERVPEQRLLVSMLEEAMLVLGSIDDHLRRQTANAAGDALPEPPLRLPTTSMVPTPLAKLHEQLDTLLVTGHMLRLEVHRLEQADAAGELSDIIRRGRFPDRGARVHPADSESLQAERHRDPAIKAMRLNRDVQRIGREVLKHVASASAWLDDPAVVAQKQWTAQVYADVRELMGCPFRGQPNDVVMSDLPWPDQGIADAMGEVMVRLERRLHELKAVERTRAAPMVLPDDGLAGYKGRLDDAEVAALLKLGERDMWGTDELPETIDADMLRCLDRHGFIEARSVHMQNQQKFPGDKTPPTPSPGEWFSPIKQPTQAGDWDAVVSRHERDVDGHPSQVRLSDLGKAERAKILRVTRIDGEIAARPGSDDASELDSNVPELLDEPTGEHAKHELDGISETTFLSESDLATEFNISQSTLRGKLPDWRKTHMNNDWLAVPDRRPKDPHYLYRVLSIYPLIEQIRRSQRGTA